MYPRSHHTREKLKFFTTNGAHDRYCINWHAIQSFEHCPGALVVAQEKWWKAAWRTTKFQTLTRSMDQIPSGYKKALDRAFKWLVLHKSSIKVDNEMGGRSSQYVTAREASWPPLQSTRGEPMVDPTFRVHTDLPCCVKAYKYVSWTDISKLGGQGSVGVQEWRRHNAMDTEKGVKTREGLVLCHSQGL